MLKQVLSSSLFFTFLLASSLSAQAQTQQPTTTQTPVVPQQPTTTQTPVVPQGQVAQAELRNFANAIKQLRVIQQESVKEMTQVVQSEGLSEQRFVQIYEAQQNPSTQSTAKITPEEQQNFRQASTKIKDIQQRTQSRMEAAVKNEGLNIQRFNQISAAIKQDPALQKQVQQMLKS